MADFAAAMPPQLGAETRVGREARASQRETTVVDPSGLEWRVRILRVQHAMTPPPPSELMAHSDPAYGWTPLPVGFLRIELQPRGDNRQRGRPQRMQ